MPSRAVPWTFGRYLPDVTPERKTIRVYPDWPKRQRPNGISVTIPLKKGVFAALMLFVMLALVQEIFSQESAEYAPGRFPIDCR